MFCKTCLRLFGKPLTPDPLSELKHTAKKARERRPAWPLPNRTASAENGGRLMGHRAVAFTEDSVSSHPRCEKGGSGEPLGKGGA